MASYGYLVEQYINSLFVASLGCTSTFLAAPCFRDGAQAFDGAVREMARSSSWNTSPARSTASLGTLTTPTLLSGFSKSDSSKARGKDTAAKEWHNSFMPSSASLRGMHLSLRMSESKSMSEAGKGRARRAEPSESQRSWCRAALRSQGDARRQHSECAREPARRVRGCPPRKGVR